MSRIFQDGFELGTPLDEIVTMPAFGATSQSLWQLNRVSSSYHDRGRMYATRSRAASGDWSLNMYFQNNTSPSRQLEVFRNLGADYTELYGRVKFNLNSANGDINIFHFRDNAFSSKASVKIGTTFIPRLYIGASQEATASTPLTGDAWHRLEFHIVVHAVTGVFEVKIDGATAMKFEGDTSSIGHVRYICLGTQANIAYYFNAYWDDIAVNDTAGTVNNDWCGEGSIVLVQPKGAGHHTTFSPAEMQNFSYSSTSATMGRQKIVAGYDESSAYSGNVAEGAFNEGSGYYQSYYTGGTGEWFQVNFVRPVVLNRLWMLGRIGTDTIKNFYIKASNDHAIWTTLDTVLFTNDGTDHTFDFTNTTAYLYYRIEIIDNWGARCRVYDARYYCLPQANFHQVLDVPLHLAYNESDTYDNIDTFDMVKLAADLAVESDSLIRAVQVVATARYVDAPADLGYLLRIGATDYAGTGKELSAEYAVIDDIVELNPADSAAWEVADIDGAEAGYKHLEHI